MQTSSFKNQKLYYAWVKAYTPYMRHWRCREGARASVIYGTLIEVWWGSQQLQPELQPFGGQQSGSGVDSIVTDQLVID